MAPRRGCPVKLVGDPANTDDHESQSVGCFWHAQLPDGSSVSGTASDAAHAARLIESVQDSERMYSCVHCAGAVGFDQTRGAWVHPYFDNDKVRCYPANPESTKAFPAPPRSRDRPFRRGLWANG